MMVTTLATILKSENKAVKPTKIWEGPVSDMEKLLMTWIEDQTQKRVPSSTMRITAREKCLFVMSKEKAAPNYSVNLLLVLGDVNDAI